MPALHTPRMTPGFHAPDFALKGVDGKTHTLQSAKGPKGLLVMFICNHCPFVQAIADRIARDARELQAAGIGVIGVMSNDAAEYPEDSFENMGAFARRNGFTFPYAIDETQAVAKAYGAVCTPDFFGFNAALELQYRGRLDASRMEPAPDAKRELLEAMRQVAETGRGPEEQQASMGCSIKWRQAAA